MKWIKTLRVRFALCVAVLILTILIIFGCFVYFKLKAGLSTEIDESLRMSSFQAIEAVAIENGKIYFSDNNSQSESIADLRDSGITLRILSLTGKVIQSFGPYQDLDVDPSTLKNLIDGPTEFLTVLPPGEQDEVRIIIIPIMDNKRMIGFVQLIQSLASVNQALSNLMTGFFISVPLLVLVAALGGYWLAARALAPIDQISSTAQKISADDLSARLNLSYPSKNMKRPWMILLLRQKDYAVWQRLFYS
jgi:nitrate/nitrite-specific signal transduction histidine kinase